MIALTGSISAFATPKVLHLNNKDGKTTVIFEIPAEDAGESGSVTIDNVALSNNGETIAAKQVFATTSENTIVTAHFKKLTVFDNCTLTFNLNGEKVSLNVQDYMEQRN